MKKVFNMILTVVFFLALLGFLNNASAKEQCKTKVVKEKTPKQFKGSGIKRKLKDGTTQVFDGNKFKIVPRTQKRKVCKPGVIYKELPPKIIVKKEVKIKRHRNRLYLMLGNGPSDSLKVTNQSGLSATVRSTDENFLGLGYSRDILDLSNNTSLSVGGFILSNETIGGSVGITW